MSAALECLHRTYPRTFLTDVNTSANEIFEYNPRVEKIPDDDPDVEKIVMEYPLINSSNQLPVHFIQGYIDFLAEQLDIFLPLCVNRPYLYLDDQEKIWLPQVHEFTKKPIKYWIINSGVKQDYTAKGWGKENYQEVVNLLRGKIQFVQIGESHHNHPKLNNVIDMVGKTTCRQLIRMCYHAEGGLGPITFIHHIFGAFEKPYVCLVGGRESVQWEQYPTSTMLNTIGSLTCCQKGGCWRSRVVATDDKDDAKNQSLCDFPVFSGNEVLPKCMTMIKPHDVVRAIDKFYEGGVLKY